MGYQAFDQYASEYDAWFMENTNVLETELRLVASCLKDSGKILSIGCGSALFEKLLADRYDIRIEHGIEPAEGMAAIARKRGFDVEINTAEEADYGENLYDTVLFNGCPCYMQDLGLALKKAHCALREGGKVVVIDVPKESPYGLIYNLALAVGTWDHPLLEGCICQINPVLRQICRELFFRECPVGKFLHERMVPDFFQNRPDAVPCFFAPAHRPYSLYPIMAT